MIYRYLRKILPKLKHPTVLEIGAHIGTDTIRLLTLLEEPRYFAVEPDPRNVEVLEKLRTEHSLDFVLVAEAITARSGPVTLYLSDGLTKHGRRHTDSSSIKQPKDVLRLRPEIKFGKTITVRGISLDDLNRQFRFGPVDFIWCDIQGAELDMIAGGQETLAQTKYLFAECIENKELYEGRPMLKDIMAALPGKWRVLFRSQTDVLLRNARRDEH